MRPKTLAGILAGLFSTGTIAAPVIYNDDIAAGSAAFTRTLNGTGASVQTLRLGDLRSDAALWQLPGVTIRATDGNNRFVYDDYNAYRAAGRTYATSGETIAIAPAARAAGSGLTFTFATPVNAFGLEVADWATCCTDDAHPDTGAPTGSNLFIAFDGGATRLVANATGAAANPGNRDYDGDGITDDVFTNFVGAIDDTASFTTVTFFGDGIGEALYAGGTLRWANVPIGSVSGQAAVEVPEPTGLALAGLSIGAGLLWLRQARRLHGRTKKR